MGVVSMKRPVAALITLLAIALQPAFAAGLNSSISFGPPTIRLEAADSQLATRTANVNLQQGQTRLALPLAELGVTPADVTLELSPPETAWVSSVYTDAEGSHWLITTTVEGPTRISVTYPVKGLTWTVGYVATLGADGSLDLKATLRLSNATGGSLDDARLIGEFTRAEVTLQNGQSATVEQPWLNAKIRPEAIDRDLLYDPAIADTPVEMLTISGDIPQRATALPAGEVRVYASPEAGSDFLTQSSLAYTPPTEPVRLNLGPAAGITVTRALAETKEADRRLDARDRVVLYDQLDTWKIEARNLRNEPLDLLVRSRHEGTWLLEDSSTDIRRLDAETIEFVMPLAPDQTGLVTYRCRHLNRQP